MTVLVLLFIALLAYTPQVPPGWPRFVYILALGALATCIVVWNGRGSDDGVRTNDEWTAEKAARLAADDERLRTLGAKRA